MSGQLAPVVHLKTPRESQEAPAVYQKLTDGLGLAMVGQFSIQGLVKHVFEHRIVVLGRVSFEVARPDQIDRVHVVGILRFRPRIARTNRGG